MYDVAMYDSTRNIAAENTVYQRKELVMWNKIIMEHTLHYLPKKKYGGKLESIEKHLARGQWSVSKL